MTRPSGLAWNAFANRSSLSRKAASARWRFGNDDSDGHLFQNPPQTIAFAFDLSRPALTLGFRVFPSAKVVDDELAELLVSIEPDCANLDGYNAAIRAPQCALYLSRRRSFGHQ